MCMSKPNEPHFINYTYLKYARICNNTSNSKISKTIQRSSTYHHVFELQTPLPNAFADPTHPGLSVSASRISTTNPVT